MAGNPFAQTTLTSVTGSTPGDGGAFINAGGVELCPPRWKSRIGLFASISFWLIHSLLAYPPSLRDVLFAAFLLLLICFEIRYLQFYARTTFVRADESGLKKLKMGKIESVRWDEIHSFNTTEFQLLGKTYTTFWFRGGKINMIFDFGDFGDEAGSARMRAFITAQLARNERKL